MNEVADKATIQFVSVVVPVFNSCQTLLQLHKRLSDALHANYRGYEIIFVNDASRDESWEILVGLYKSDPNHVMVVDLASNSGQQIALMCGLRLASGDAVVTLDDDLQNPPEDIPKLVNKLEEGYDAVFGTYICKKHSTHRNVGSYLVRRLNQTIFRLPDSLRFSSFRALSRGLVNELKQIQTSYPYISGLICERTSRVSNVTVTHNERVAGKSGYTLSKLITLSLNLIINYSTIPLRIVGYLGVLLGLTAGLWALVAALNALTRGTAPTGYTSLVLLVAFGNVVIVAMLLTLGIYVQRMLRQTTQGPSYFVREVWKRKSV